MRKGWTLVTMLASCMFVSSLMASDMRKPKRTTTPPYPPLAKQMRVSGSVKLEATVDANGIIEDVKVLSGHPLLKSAAAECVRQWSYESGAKSVESIEVVFKLPN